MHVQFGWTVLMRAAANGQVDCARMLLDAGANKDATSNVRRRSLRLLLFECFSFFHAVIVFADSCHWYFCCFGFLRECLDAYDYFL